MIKIYNYRQKFKSKYRNLKFNNFIKLFKKHFNKSQK